MEEGEFIKLSDFLEDIGEKYYQAAANIDLEGIMAKRKDSHYQSGLRSADWLKIKMHKSCDCIIFGYTKGTGIRAKTFGALILGLYDKEIRKRVFVGKVGTGFSEQTLENLMFKFRKLEVEKAPFDPKISDIITWLKPKLVCEIHFDSVTRDGKLRMPRFHALREDKSPLECTVDQLFPRQFLEYASKRKLL